jgi:hypothetical protein
VFISYNALSPFLHFSPLHSSSCNIQIALTNFTIMSYQCDLQPTSKVEMDWARRIKCALASGSNLEGKYVSYLSCLIVYILHLELCLCHSKVWVIFYILYFLYVRYVCTFFFYKFIFLILWATFYIVFVHFLSKHPSFKSPNYILHSTFWVCLYIFYLCRLTFLNYLSCILHCVYACVCVCTLCLFISFYIL